MGVDAHTMHVALGLEPDARAGGEVREEDSVDVDNASDEADDKLPPVLVTFEGSARGLHFEGVNAVFVIGRPA